MSPKQVAHDLAGHFLRQGQYEDVARAASGIEPVQAAAQAEEGSDLGGFFGLQVRAVGYADKATELNERGCYIYVTRSTRRAERQLPTEVEGVSLHLRRVGRMVVKPEISAAASTNGYTYRRKGVICCGTSISVSGYQLAGTLGALVKDSKGNLYALSNNHVIGGCNHIGIGEPVLSPSILDLGPNSPPVEQFGRFHGLLELRSGDVGYVPTNNFDAAIAVVETKISSYQGEHFDTPPRIGHFNAGMAVKKVGRTTRLSRGIVESRVSDFFPLPYKSIRFSATVNFDNVWAIRTANAGEPFALPGDSGSLIVSDDGRDALGLLFAATLDGKYGWAAPLADVLKQFGNGLTLVSGL